MLVSYREHEYDAFIQQQMKTTVRRDGTSTSPTLLSGRKSSRSLVGCNWHCNIHSKLAFSVLQEHSVKETRNPKLLQSIWHHNLFSKLPVQCHSLSHILFCKVSLSVSFLIQNISWICGTHACYILRLYQLPMFRLPKLDILNYRRSLYMYHSICFAEITNLMTDSHKVTASQTNRNNEAAK